ncbi:MAG: methylmalonyl Co-A mutase-associated GTPase MeaB [Alphaproteobacteria bacterium]|nr:methylmalonyl Co-A mutase-associated GTPase MeaB [Alphaproteobacteria bacterium]
MTASPDIAALADSVTSGDRRALARAITRAESTRPDHRAEVAALLEMLLPKTGNSVRLGITGVPGVGKSTFIEVFGKYLIDRGHRVAVLAVDPSSKLSGGSILGDKTRMEDLARDPAAFIRPSPTGRTLGGVARRTREAMLICEAAGFDIVIVETVGVGQSETTVADMVDLFMLLLLPGGGDDLQGLKKGIVEIADLLVVNKADGDLVKTAGRTVADYRSALHLLRPMSQGWSPPVLACSAREGSGIDAIWEAIGAYREAFGPDGIAARRAGQAKAWMWNEISETLVEAFRADADVAARVVELEAEAAAGRVTAGRAAQELLALFLDRQSG